MLTFAVNFVFGDDPIYKPHQQQQKRHSIECVFTRKIAVQNPFEKVEIRMSTDG